MIDKRARSLADAVQGMQDGAIIPISSFGEAGVPTELVEALAKGPARDLVVISNGAGFGRGGIAKLLATGWARTVERRNAATPARRIRERRRG